MMPFQLLQLKMTSKCGRMKAGMISWIGLTLSMSVVTNMFSIFGLALLQVKMSQDARGCENCRTKTNISVGFTISNPNIAELIHDRESTPKRQVAGDLNKKLSISCNSLLRQL
jgi:hypothetical protein